MNVSAVVIQSGDFIYFAPAGKAFTVPAPGVVSVSSLPGSTDAIWTTYPLGTVLEGKPVMSKFSGKDVIIKSPIAGTGIIAAKQIIRPERGLTMEFEMNEMSRTALAAFYKATLIEAGDTSFSPLTGGGSITGWLQCAHYDSENGVWLTENWWVDLDVSEFAAHDGNVLSPKFKATWLYSALSAGAI